MQQFTFSFLMSNLQSTQIQQAVASAVFFGAAGALRGAAARFESFTRTIHSIQDRYPERAEKMRSSNMFHELEKKMEQAAKRAAGIHAIAEANNVMIRLEFEPPIAKPMSQAELTKLAELTNIKADVIKDVREKADKRRYDAECEAADLAASLFWSACADGDAPVKFDTVSKAIERTRINLLTWSQPNIAELALIAMDERALNNWMEVMSDDPQQFALDDDEIEAQHLAAEKKALDAHAAQQQTIAYLDAERKKAARTGKAKRTRVAKPKAETTS